MTRASRYSPCLSAQVARTAVQWLTAAAFLAALGGCGEAIQNTGEDNNYIRDPGAASDTSANARLAPAPLLPVRTSTWRNKIVTRRTAGSATGSRDPNLDDHGNPFAVLYETVTARPVSGSSSLLITSQTEKQKTQPRTELYLTTPKAVLLSRVTGEPALAVTPPLPLFRLPLREDGIVKWTGSLQLQGKTYPAQGYSRVRSPEKFRENSKTLIYRVDTALIVDVDGRPVSYSMNRWFEPGVGLVRQRYFVNNLERVRERVSSKS